MAERTETRELACKLTVEELAVRRDRLIDVLDEVEAEEYKLDAFKKATKGRCSVLESERDKLRRAGCVRKGRWVMIRKLDRVA